MNAFSTIFFILLQLILSVKCDTSPSIIIVGAGAAGIAAASRLLKNNFTNIKILEAEERIGGRIYSTKFGDIIVDLGAEWVHGETVYNLVKDLDVLEPTDFSKIFYHSSNKYIDQNFANEIYKIFNEIFNQSVEASEGISLGQYLSDKYNEKIKKLYRNDIAKLNFAFEFLDILKKEALLAKGTFSWFDLSAKSDYVESAAIQGLNWKGRGFKTILDILMQTYPNSQNQLTPFKDKIIFNKEVIKIVWDEKISIQCLDDSIYKADHVILTTSLGVLKDRYNTLFYPPLPQEKIDAIKELGIAAVTKVFFHFPQRWWPDKFKSIALFWTFEDTVELYQEFPNYPDMSDRSWLLDLAGIYTISRNPNVLEAWIVGQSVPKVETFSDEKLIDGIMFTLNKFLGNEFKNITEPDSILRFNWYSNPHFRGTYSYQTIQSRKREVSGEIALSKPLTSSSDDGKQVLLFAGEATSPTHYATVHGAIETGFREADRIINIYK